MNSTSWQNVSGWYQKSVGKEGNYFHQHVVVPKTLKLMSLNDRSAVLDLACGQGILARSIPKNIYYQGIDLSHSLIGNAIKYDRNPNHLYNVGDITKPLPIVKRDFTHIAVILALQNIEFPDQTIQIASKHLARQGKIVIVLNHPCFRIPRQSSWGIDDQNKLQYRKINRYLSPLKIPITAHPGQGPKSALTWSFHQPLTFYSECLYKSGFLIEKIEEWSSDKMSEGKAAKMENFARSEIPLFMAILAVKSK